MCKKSLLKASSRAKFAFNVDHPYANKHTNYADTTVLNARACRLTYAITFYIPSENDKMCTTHLKDAFKLANSVKVC